MTLLTLFSLWVVSNIPLAFIFLLYFFCSIHAKYSKNLNEKLYWNVMFQFVIFNRSFTKPNSFIHFNLCVAILLAQSTFLSGISSTKNKVNMTWIFFFFKFAIEFICKTDSVLMHDYEALLHLCIRIDWLLVNRWFIKSLLIIIFKRNYKIK